MFPLEIVLLGVALAIDAAVVAFAISLLHRNDSPSGKLRNGILVSTLFGGFQFLMLWLGSYFGYLFTYSNYGYFFQVSTGMIFVALALKCIHESFTLEEKKIEWKVVPVIILAFITSIDALAAGISLGTFPRAYFAGLEVGMITFLITGSFYLFGQFFKDIPDKWLLRFASLIFLFLGAQIFWAFRTYLLKG